MPNDDFVVLTSGEARVVRDLLSKISLAPQSFEQAELIHSLAYKVCYDLVPAEIGFPDQLRTVNKEPPRSWPWEGVVLL